MTIPPALNNPTYPNVPNVPGVPPVARQILNVGNIQNTAILALADVANVVQLFTSVPQWGIFLNGRPAIVGDTIVSFEFNGEYRISSAPQEQGAFVSFNKVQEPFEGKVTFFKAGSIAERQAFVTQIETAVASLNTGYALVMPEIVWLSVNVVRRNFVRTSEKGANSLTVDVWVEQVRVTGTTQFSNTVNQNSANPVSGGQVQGLAPTPKQSSAIYEPN